ncbi:unnamed protein product [Aphis gossypii]|uniref:Uncharacterized protein n=1 Tax=Aphis gossypii TaxID=80765 RepID=A0A9P0NGT3_APHGO|nr:unnamed protein product [Aphis gossypii]
MESHQSNTRDHNHNEIEPNAMFIGDPETIRENGRGRRRRLNSSDDVTVQYSSRKRRRIVNEVHTSSANEPLINKYNIPVWMRPFAKRRYKFDGNRTLQPIIEVSLNNFSDDEIIDDDNNAVISSTDNGDAEDVDMLNADDENGTRADEAMEEDN